MKLVKCFDVVSMVVDEATEEFGGFFWKLNQESYDILKQYCDVIDSLSDEFGGIAYDVSVDDITHMISITLECDEIVIINKKHRFYDLAERSELLKFSISKNGNLNVGFVFPSVWDTI